MNLITPDADWSVLAVVALQYNIYCYWCCNCCSNNIGKFHSMNSS